MDKEEILQQLKKFQITGTKGEIFKTHKYLLSWIDKVAPLLKYSNEHYSTFMNAANKVMIPGISSQTGVPCLNIMKSTVNRAIIELENDIQPIMPQKDIQVKHPKTITLQWLWIHVPWRYWVSFLLLLFAAFSLGIKFANTKLYKSLISPANPITKEKSINSASEKSPK